MAKIISFDTFCYRRELKAIEKAAESRRNSINRILDYARKNCNWEKDNDPADNPVVDG